MNYLERYRNGEYEQVWGELQALDAAVRQEPYASQAREVAAETMRRVRNNCELIVARLGALGYRFGIYPDGSKGYYTNGPLVASSSSMRADYAELEAQVGPLPLSLVAFWQAVGTVDLVGMRPGWPTLLDPLVIDPPEAILSEIDMIEDEDDPQQFEASLAPDNLHKDNTSGGDPYGVALPDPSADFVFLNERHTMLFVPYLRLAILQWGGFPGLDGTTTPFEPLADLVAGLEPF